jgi:hypothetical protein
MSHRTTGSGGARCPPFGQNLLLSCFCAAGRGYFFAEGSGGAGAANWHALCNVLVSTSARAKHFREVRPPDTEKIAMASENVAVLYGNNALDIKLEAARLMREALSRPDDADVLISMAIQLFNSANADAIDSERRA